MTGHLIQLVVDGGSKGNGARNAGYGSFKVRHNGQDVEITHPSGEKTSQATFDFDGCTNNKSECMIMIEAMEYLDDLLHRWTGRTNPVSIIIGTDSRIVYRACTVGIKKASESLAPLYVRMQHQISQITCHDNVTIEFKKMGGDQVKMILGH